jgi:hypothetical protein
MIQKPNQSNEHGCCVSTEVRTRRDERIINEIFRREVGITNFLKE